MGLKKIGQGIKDAATGVVNFAAGTAGQMLNDSFAEYFQVPLKGNEDLLLIPAEQVHRDMAGKGKANMKGTENHITNGSVFDVPINYCAILVENGKVHDCVIANTNELAGKYRYTTDVEPSWFTGSTEGFVDGTKSRVKQLASDAFAEFKHRAAFGGQSTNTMYLFYISLKPRIFKVGGPVTARDPETRRVLKLGVNGSVGVKIGNPVLFYENWVNDPLTPMSISSEDGSTYVKAIRTTINSRLKDVVKQVINEICKDGDADFSDFEGRADLLQAAIADQCGETLLTEYGMILSPKQINLNVNFDPADLEKLEKRWAMKDEGSDADIMRNKIVEGQLEAQRIAAGNSGGAMMGFMGAGMSSMYGAGMSGFVDQTAQSQQMRMSQEREQAEAKAKANSWTCSCGVTGITSKCCPECGKPKPAPVQGWTCECGQTNITSKCCPECGKPKPAPKPATRGWTCECGATNITSKFCPDCGKPEPPKTEGWTCECGQANITSKFCPSCGKPKPAESAAPKGWNCECGATGITSNFCPDCGKKKQESRVYKCDKCGWVPDDPKHPPKFCPDCGDVFDDNDVT